MLGLAPGWQWSDYVLGGKHRCRSIVRSCRVDHGHVEEAVCISLFWWTWGFLLQFSGWEGGPCPRSLSNSFLRCKFVDRKSGDRVHLPNLKYSPVAPRSRRGLSTAIIRIYERITNHHWLTLPHRNILSLLLRLHRSKGSRPR